MRINKSIQLLLICVFSLQGIAQKTTQYKTQLKNIQRFESEINQFEKQDKESFPPKNAVLFIGSSSFRLWKTLKEDFHEIELINRGFGGSQTEEALYYFDRIVKPYQPKTIVYYEGTNDLADGDNPKDVVRNVELFILKVKKTLPKTKIIVLSNSVAVKRKLLADKFTEANVLLQKMISKYRFVRYVDVSKSVQFDNGMPRPELFVGDSIHMNADGYSCWTKVLRPYLIK